MKSLFSVILIALCTAVYNDLVETKVSGDRRRTIRPRPLPTVEVTERTTEPPTSEVNTLPPQTSSVTTQAHTDSSSNPISGPVQPTEGQCSFGTNSTFAPFTSSFATTDRLYVEFGSPATCNGVVARLEICFTFSEPSSEHTIDFAVLQLNQSSSGYDIISLHTHKIQLAASSLESTSICNYTKVGGDITLNQGDLLGFVCNNNLRVALSDLPQGENSTLKIFNFSPQSQQNSKRSLARVRVKRSSPLIGISSIMQESFVSSSQRVTPLLRVIMNSTDNATTSIPTTSEEPTSCSSDDGGGANLYSSAVFISVVVVAVVIILVLLIVVFFMGCYLCQKKCGRVLCCCCFRKREIVTHTIRVEPLFEQSMQYNDLYVPTNPNEMIFHGQKISANVKTNPAYSGSQVDIENDYGQDQSPSAHKIDVPSTFDTKSSAEAADTRSQCRLVDDDNGRMELEHTYEVMESIA